MAEAMRNDLIRKYSDMDIDELLSQLNENELEQLSGMVRPSVVVFWRNAVVADVKVFLEEYRMAIDKHNIRWYAEHLE